MNETILNKAKLWGQDTYFSAEDRAEVNELINKLPASEIELTERFHSDLEFGTGGLRAPMGMGQSRMNKYNVRKATQALCNNIIKNFGGGSAVISYDSRNFSKDFAKEAAGVFAGNGIKAYIYSALTPTPMLSFGVRYYKAQAGIMITASHNPPIYNGYKAYWNDGGQVVPPVDKHIIESYNGIADWNEIKYLPFDEAISEKLVEWTDEKVDEAFYKIIESKVIQNHDMCKKDGSKLSIVYTALHGTGQVPCMTAAKRVGFTHIASVPEQAMPDGNFPTVKSPNPEDPKALAMAVDTMMKTNADIVFGTDPDGDRLGLALNDHGKAAYINGNQIAALMLYYVFKTKAQNKTLPENALVVKSIVTSPIQNAIVEYFGGTVMDTLTGFKWMAGLLQELEDKKSKFNFVFASEESFGYMPHSDSRDKDGVSSMALMAEVALYFKLQGKNLIEALDEIYEKFGFYYESLVSLDYEGLSGAAKISRIMEYFRNFPETHFAGEEIIAKEDYLTSLATDIKFKSTKKIDLPKSNVLSFTFASGNKLFLRPSGTEPKIKFYTMVRETEGTNTTKKSKALGKVAVIESTIKESCEKA